MLFTLLKKAGSRIAEMAAGIRPIVLTGPSGTGKSTILTRAMKDFPTAFAFSVSHTTRQAREGEIHGKQYFFTDRAKMLEMIDNGDFFEHAEFGGNLYGTSKRTIQEIQESGRICVLDLELQGVRSVKKLNIPAKFILIRAPSLEILEQRLRDRGTETEKNIQQRLKHAAEDDLAAQNEPQLFDKVIVNDVLDVAYKEFLDAIKEELDAVLPKSQNNNNNNGLNGHRY